MMKTWMAALVMLLGCTTSVPAGQHQPGQGGGGDSDNGTPSDGTPPITEAPTPAASYDCTALEAPLSTHQFYEDNPTYTDPVDDTASWTTSTPAAEGIDAAMLESASATLQRNTLDGVKYMWSFLVVRNDKLVFERYYNGATKSSSNNVHSASKSIWGAAMGIAIGKGMIPSIDTPISQLLPASYVSAMTSATEKTITEGDLVTMTSGLRWTEDTSENQIQRATDWMAAILALPMAAAPGATFNYSTGNAHLNSAVLATVAKTTACEFIHKNLLAPMGVVAEHWGRDPQGYFSGGYNLYLTPRELAKFGMLYLHDGNWQGQQLVPRDWVTASMADQTDAGDPYTYGYDFWLRTFDTHHVAMAWGFGGQMVFIVKDLNMVVVMTTNTRDLDEDFDLTEFFGDSILPAAH